MVTLSQNLVALSLKSQTMQTASVFSTDPFQMKESGNDALLHFGQGVCFGGAGR